MYFVLYDRHLKSIGETYILESWSRIQRAVDFDDIKIEGAQIPYYADPFLVAVNDRQGRLLFSGLASTPTTDDKTKKTTIILKDYLTLLNSEIIIDWSQFSGEYLDEYIDFILRCWKSQTDVGLSDINWNLSKIKNITLDTDIIRSGIESIKAYDLISGAIHYYNLYCESSLHIPKKALTYTFKKGMLNSLSVKLRDFGIDVIEKSYGEYNRATVYDNNYVKQQTWALTSDNEIVKLPSERDILYPAKNKNFIAEAPTEELSAAQAINNAAYSAVMSLAENRYQENIDLDAQQYKSVFDLTNTDFSYKISVYTDQGYYKDLPIGEIETDSKGKHIIRLGERISELTQEI